MNVLHPDIWRVADDVPVVLDLAQLAEVVAQDEAHAAEGDCTQHDDCRQI